jgi:predicted O-methyltransferase YrrM
VRARGRQWKSVGSVLMSLMDRVRPGSRLGLRWVKRAGWLGTELPERVPAAPQKRRIEAAAEATNSLGPQHVAEEYGELGATRTPGVVRSSSECGDLYAWLVLQRQPNVVVEFGSAFGVSGMYFAAGLEAVGNGHLYSFEINNEWAKIAERNIATISNRFTLTRGSFEDHIDSVPGPIDLVLVDGIHTYDFVMRQFEILQPRMSAGGIVIFDDIDFAKAGSRMREAWREIAATKQVVGAVEIRGRQGIAEV